MPSSADATPRLHTNDLPQRPRAPDTPSTRTGPPRFLSYNYSNPGSPNASRSNSKHEDNGPTDGNDVTEHGEWPFLPPDASEFRDALEVRTPSDRKGKKKESSRDKHNGRRWFQESPREERDGFNFETPTAPASIQDHGLSDTESISRLPPSGLRRTSSVPEQRKQSNPKWGRLRALMTNVTPSTNPRSAGTQGVQAVSGHSVNITDELITGGLSTLMLRLWHERDENDQRRIPVFFHRLRLRISDSLHPLHGHKTVFRIECEYGPARWVIYRQLKDFISLHYHYSFSNAYRRNVENMPEFPRTSIPYLKFLQKEGKEKGKHVDHAEFARLQREALETYLVDLIRAVMFHPATNRLAGFLEISALFIQLAGSGNQSKAGELRIEAVEPKPTGGWGRKGVGWRAKRELRWCALRDSYLVALQEPGELDVWDVFLFDSDFKIERPTRYYRQLHLRHNEDDNPEEHPNSNSMDSERRSMLGSFKSKITNHLRRSTSHSRIDGLPRSRRSSSSSSSGSSVSSRPPTPLLDPSTNVDPLSEPGEKDDPKWIDSKKKKRSPKDVSRHTFYISNSQMRLRVTAKNERQMLQWIAALERVAAQCHYTGQNRFDSFAPIRLNVAAQWLVDGRDYFWNLSRAILLAKESIYIHDWWLSPELQLRRPNKDRYRLDRLLERKAKEGVKIFIIVYKEVSSRTTPTDSNYTKQTMMSLHPNIMVQRSPSHFQTGTFYWAHHEKLCVIDQTIAFMGGLDLCFGRWDTPQHSITDDGEDTGAPEVWPGKDYSNARVLDFHTLNRPFDDMYDRTKVPRMPWHDVGMQIVGQPVRDLARHFVQRWNYLLRIKNHSRAMPFLIPPSDFRPGELSELGLTGTCEMQICRSAGPWSLGTPDRIEHSIQNAYLKAIQMSEHFVYIENQFFITSTVVNDVKVENKIGDALVHRIIRAHRDKTPWKCCVVIPLLPGFAFPLDHTDASSIRLILECQNRTIGRGPNSIFSRLRKEGIDPDDYITVFSLRNWGKLRDVLHSEQVYIHGKVCIVDDRLAIIGSANINERSQRGDRDSELASVIRDTDMIDSTMAGKPFKVGRFAHTLRVRLMREHAGIDVDNLHEDYDMHEPAAPEGEEAPVSSATTEQGAHGTHDVGAPVVKTAENPLASAARTGIDGVETAIHGAEEVISKEDAEVEHEIGIKPNSVGDETLNEERQTYTRDGRKVPGFADSVVPTTEEKIVNKQIGGALEREKEVGKYVPAEPRTSDGDLFGAPADASRSAKSDNAPPQARSGVDDADEEEKMAPRARSTIRRHLQAKLSNKTWTVPTVRPQFDKDSFEDPVVDHFWEDIWLAAAVHNTEIFRKVFHAIPDDLVTTWKQYKEFVVHHERLSKPPRDTNTPDANGRVPSEVGDTNASEAGLTVDGQSEAQESTTDLNGEEGRPRARSRAGKNAVEPFTRAERDEMEKLLSELCGHLVLYPTRFLEGEDVANNFLFNADRLLPLPIYD
ncbi:phospholipase D [Cylindrobasidium torrendii FP15055 ss-10]|uniref:Phospholipase n=1 Tax=Cylindrobasidium torrendii FP15055 ss-10 TaxID=1314674 RepID=A0A0D7BNF6_9AGAR|nr:phospholipase D [Cylindrobasidium torrendii FP15055 ss-10]